jgi:regulator of PEP synthase PpsR (kinase-PPPase family)
VPDRLPISIHVVSDSLGETGEMVARAAAGQFEPDAFRIERLP